jgi:PBP1b-binding outer membrane lipoprotein LpoB
MKTIILVILILGLVLTGCQKQVVEPAPEKVDTGAIDDDLSDIDTLDEDLGIDDLNGLEEDLDAIDW